MSPDVRPRPPEHRPSLALVLVAVLAGAAALLLIGASTLLTVAFTDYETEALPAVERLTQGDLRGFLELLPAYGGSLVLRSPAIALTDLAGGGELAVYRALAVPCLAAALAFGLALWSRLATRRGHVAAWMALAVVVANPILLPALDQGHPEEVLGAVLCAAAVMAALADRPLAAGILLGLAGANKAWAVLAVIPVLLALREGRVRALAAAGGVCAAVLAPALLLGSQGVTSAGAVAGETGAIFQPWQWTWFLGDHGGIVVGGAGEKVGYRTSPAFLTSLGHLPVVLVPLGFAALAALRRVPREQALLLLAVLFLLRCVSDPWDTAYYHLPFLLALAAHEVVARGRAPVLTLAATVAVHGSTVWARDALTPDAQALLYLLWSVPAVAGGLVALLMPRLAARAGARAGQALERTVPALVRSLGPEDPQPTTVSSLGSPPSTSWPSSVTMTRSSMRTPTAPGT